MADEHHSEGPIHTTAPVVAPGLTFASVTDKISSIVLKRKTPLWWFAVTGAAGGLAGVLVIALGYLFYKGTGIWGVNQPTGWASRSSTSCGGSASATPAR